MDVYYFAPLLVGSCLLFLFLFFIFATAVAVYLKVFVAKKSECRKFITSKYIGISRSQTKIEDPFYIFYDLFMLLVLSLLSYSALVNIFLSPFPNVNSDSPLYLFAIFGIFLGFVLLLVKIVPIEELEGIKKLKWSLPRAPEGVIMIWAGESRFGKVYGFFLNYLRYALLLFFAGLAMTLFYLFSAKQPLGESEDAIPSPAPRVEEPRENGDEIGGEEIFCTMDAKECPDGSFVGRDPKNNCQFNRCPGEEVQ